MGCPDGTGGNVVIFIFLCHTRGVFSPHSFQHCDGLNDAAADGGGITSWFIKIRTWGLQVCAMMNFVAGVDDVCVLGSKLKFFEQKCL